LIDGLFTGKKVRIDRVLPSVIFQVVILAFAGMTVCFFRVRTITLAFRA